MRRQSRKDSLFLLKLLFCKLAHEAVKPWALWRNNKKHTRTRSFVKCLEERDEAAIFVLDSVYSLSFQYIEQNQKFWPTQA